MNVIKIKNLFLIILLVIAIGIFTTLSKHNKKESEDNKENVNTEITNEIVLKYPKEMIDKGFTEEIRFSEMPKRVVVATYPPVLALHKLGVNMIAIPDSKTPIWPKELDENTFKVSVGRKSNLKIETIIEMNPDLIFLSASNKDKYDHLLKDANIPVYYIEAGHSIDYDNVKSQTIALIDAFGKNTKASKEILDSFTSIENKISETKRKYDSKTVMALQYGQNSPYIQSEKGIIGALAKMVGFTNVYVNEEASMVPINTELALTYNPNVIMCVSGMEDPKVLQNTMENDFSKNADYWYSIDAIKNKRVIYFSSKFLLNTGIGYLNNIEEFIRILDEQYEL